MSSSLDMSLDDLIKSNKKSGANLRERGRARAGRRSGPARRFPNRPANRPAPYAMGKAPDTVWQHDMYSSHMAAAASSVAAAARASSIETGTKLYISNLDYGVSNEDIKELFSGVGDLKHFSIHYDKSGRSKGTAEVVFSRWEDAFAGMKRYNNVQLDGKPMHIELIGTNIVMPAPTPLVLKGGFRNSNGVPKIGSGRVGSAVWPCGGGDGRGRGRGRGHGTGRPESITAEALDADLDEYHSEAMQIN